MSYFYLFHKFVDSIIYRGLSLEICFIVCKAIITIELSLGARRSIGLIHSKIILAILKTIISRYSSQGSLSPIGLIPIHFFIGCKEIITKESNQGSLRHIGLIPITIFNWLQVNNIKRVYPRGTKVHWVNPYQFFSLAARK